jgi:peptidoglycan/LPS O-acetylase OafA/YrhL
MGTLKVVYHIALHVLGLGCVAACIAIVGTMGALDIHWTGWIAVAFLGLLAIGIAVGWFPWRGKPLRVLLKGFYVMSAVALIGFGFSMQDPMRPQLWMVLAPLAAAIVVRIVFRTTTRGRNGQSRTQTDPAPPPEMAPVRKAADDPFFN